MIELLHPLHCLWCNAFDFKKLVDVFNLIILSLRAEYSFFSPGNREDYVLTLNTSQNTTLCIYINWSLGLMNVWYIDPGQMNKRQALSLVLILSNDHKSTPCTLFLPTLSRFWKYKLSSQTKALVIPQNSLIHHLFYIAQCPNTWFKELSHIPCITIMEGNDKTFRSINMWCIK